MKLNREGLILRVMSLIRQREEAVTVAREQDMVRAESDKAAYVLAYGDDWQTFAGNIMNNVRRGIPVTAEDVPERLVRWGREVRFYSGPTIADRQDDARTDDLRTLLAVLESSDDEYVTSGDLIRLGAPVPRLIKIKP